MNRRSLFKSLVACVAASAMEVCGWRMPKPTDSDEEIEALSMYENATYEDKFYIHPSPTQDYLDYAQMKLSATPPYSQNMPRWEFNSKTLRWERCA